MLGTHRLRFGLINGKELCVKPDEQGRYLPGWNWLNGREVVVQPVYDEAAKDGIKVLSSRPMPREREGVLNVEPLLFDHRYRQLPADIERAFGLVGLYGFNVVQENEVIEVYARLEIPKISEQPDIIPLPDIATQIAA